MFVMDTPEVPPSHAPVMIVQAAQAQLPKTAINRTVGICHLISNPPNPPLTAVNSFGPVSAVNAYFIEIEHREVGLEGKVSLVQGPEHGIVKEEWGQNYRYHPAANYYGPDSAVFMVEIGGYKVKVHYQFKVMQGAGGGTDGNDPYQNRKNCPNGPSWRISSSVANDLDIAFDPLSVGAVGSVQAHTITLDPTAAGHGWFIDYTPYLNEEFLPTSNPYVWKAKPGSEAEGKMDMLSVLWHELGHAKGLDHTTDGQGLMSTTLAPGMRKLPTPEELAVLNSLNPPQSPFVKGGSDSSDLVETAASLLPLFEKGGQGGFPLAPFANAAATQKQNKFIGKKLTPDIVRKIEKLHHKEGNNCLEYNSDPNDPAFESTWPAIPGSDVFGQLKYVYHIELTTAIKTRITQLPKHGVMIIADSNYPIDSRNDPKGTGRAFSEKYRYIPNAAYLKSHEVYEDSVRFEVEVNGHKFRLNYVIEVNGGCNYPENEYESSREWYTDSQLAIRLSLDSIEEITLATSTSLTNGSFSTQRNAGQPNSPMADGARVASRPRIKHD